MNTLSPDIAAALGFDADQAFEQVADLETRAATVDQGSLETVALALAAFIETVVAREPHFRPVPSPPALIAEARCEVQQWERAPGIFLVRADDPSVTFRGVDEAHMYRASTGEVFVDARERPFHLRVGLGGASQVWAMSAPKVTVFAPRASEASRSPSAQALSRWAPHVAAAVEVPQPAQVFAGLAPPDWMRVEVASRLAVGTAWEVASAWGMAARLAPSERSGSVLDLLDAPPPEAPALAWLARNPEAARELASHVVHEADRLVEDLDPLSDALAADAPDARDRALAWLHRRDDLASVAFVLTRADVDVGAVHAALARVDRAAGLRQTMWAFLEPLDDPRLASVSWQEPDAWWAEVTLGR